jgi:hypothetical protein
VTAQPVHPNASDRVTSDPALLVLTATTDRIAADPTTPARPPEPERRTP